MSYRSQPTDKSVKADHKGGADWTTGKISSSLGPHLTLEANCICPVCSVVKLDMVV